MCLEKAVSIEQAGSDSSLRHTEHLADFVVLETLNIVQCYHCAVVFGQLHHGVVQPFL